LLAARFIAPAGALVPVGGGQIAQTFTFTAEGRAYIIRFNHTNMLVNLEKEAYIYRHFAAPLQDAVKAEPKACIAWLALGWNYVLLDELLEAHSSLARALDLETAGPPAHRFTGTAGYLAECLRRQGRLEEAREQALAGIEAVERSDHMYRDTLRAGCLCALGRTALDQSDRDGAAAAFRQALLQLRGRPRALGGGHLAAQALAGLSRAGEGDAALDEALQLFDDRAGLDFHAFYGCSDPETLQALAEAADALGRPEQSTALLARGRGEATDAQVRR
jgi:tetratricopeptide (TPR) repeat protein